jgi:hypothetical protein
MYTPFSAFIADREDWLPEIDPSVVVPICITVFTVSPQAIAAGSSIDNVPLVNRSSTNWLVRQHYVWFFGGISMLSSFPPIHDRKA